MKYSIIYSRFFLEKVFNWTKEPRAQAFAASEHTSLDPNLHDYVRQNIVPYRQKIGLTNGQMKLYFLIVSSSQIFVVWINDDTCPHNTWNARTDPCDKEWQKLKSNNKLEVFDPNFHFVDFKVKPQSAKPIHCRSTYLGHQVNVGANLDPEGSGKYIGYSFYCDETCSGIDLIHVKQFLALLHAHLTGQNIVFEFQFIKAGHQKEIDLIIQSYDPIQWKIIDDKEDFILQKI